MTVTETIEAWRQDWYRQQIKHGISDGDYQDWKDYLDSLSMSEVIEYLSIYGEE